jgi:hypothetical protein
LVATVISDTQINLTWNASAATGLSNYKVYRSLSSGFTPSSGNLIASPVANSYNNTGLTLGTTYYYKVSAVNNVGEGTASAQVSAKTTGTAPLPTESIYYNFNSNTANTGTLNVITSPTNAVVVTSNPAPKFGAGSIKFDNQGILVAQSTGDLTLIAPNFSTGFSLSFWINIRDNANLAKNRLIVMIRGTSDNENVWIYLSNKRLMAMVYNHVNPQYAHKQFPNDVMNENVWYHIGLVYTSTNNLTLYKDGIPDAGDVIVNNNPPFTQTAPCLVLGGAPMGTGTSVDIQTRFDGNIDEFRYFQNRVLTSTEINNLKNTNAP